MGKVTRGETLLRFAAGYDFLECALEMCALKVLKGERPKSRLADSEEVRSALRRGGDARLAARVIDSVDGLEPAGRVGYVCGQPRATPGLVCIGWPRVSAVVCELWDSLQEVAGPNESELLRSEDGRKRWPRLPLPKAGEAYDQWELRYSVFREEMGKRMAHAAWNSGQPESAGGEGVKGADLPTEVPAESCYDNRSDKSPLTATYIEERCARSVVEAFKRYLDGDGPALIADSLNAEGVIGPRNQQWTGRLVVAMLRNPVYIGRVLWNDESYEGRHKPIVGAELWDAVQARLATGQRGQSRKPWTAGLEGAETPALVGVVRDASGEPFKRYWAKGSTGVVTFHYQDPTTGQRINARELDRELLRALRATVASPEFFAGTLDAARQEVGRRARVVFNLTCAAAESIGRRAGSGAEAGATPQHLVLDSADWAQVLVGDSKWGDGEARSPERPRLGQLSHFADGGRSALFRSSVQCPTTPWSCHPPASATSRWPCGSSCRRASASIRRSAPRASSGAWPTFP